MNKTIEYKMKLILTFPLNLIVLLLVKHYFGFEVAVLVWIATAVATIDEFGYLYKLQTKGGKE